MKPKIMRIQGNMSSDKRGSVKFFNDFKLEGVKRFYQVENSVEEPIRAFHGHINEAKYVYVVQGSVLLCAVYLDDKLNPSKSNKVERFYLSEEKPEIIYIPPSYANGFKSLKEGSRVIFFSTSSLEQSLKDDYRFPFDYWGEEVWEYEK
jgi:dTDP-4-dehydrorhamnose 3,5-epimerase-like enzyme